MAIYNNVLIWYVIKFLLSLQLQYSNDNEEYVVTSMEKVSDA